MSIFRGDIFMVLDDTLGRNRPCLEEFLQKDVLPRDRQLPQINHMPSVGTFDPDIWTHSTQVDRYHTHLQPPAEIQRASSSPWLSHQPHFTSVATLPSVRQKLPIPA